MKEGINNQRNPIHNQSYHTNTDEDLDVFGEGLARKDKAVYGNIRNSKYVDDWNHQIDFTFDDSIEETNDCVKAQFFLLFGVKGLLKKWKDKNEGNGYVSEGPANYPKWQPERLQTDSSYANC